MCVRESPSHVRLCGPMGCSPPRGSSVPGTLQARIVEWVSIFFSRGSSWPRDQTWVSHVAGRFFTIWATREAQEKTTGLYFLVILFQTINCKIQSWITVPEETTTIDSTFFSYLNISEIRILQWYPTTPFGQLYFLLGCILTINHSEKNYQVFREILPTFPKTLCTMHCTSVWELLLLN